MSKSLALFDFDGTLTNRDTLLDFIIYTVGIPKTMLGSILLSPILLSYKIGFCNNQEAKEKVISHFFKGWKVEKFSEVGSDYSRSRLPKILKDSALEKLKWHINRGHEVVVVSASIEEWIIDWTNRLNINLIATQLEKNGDILTGEFESKNCFGSEKVRRIKQQYNIEAYDCIYAYGDTDGDKPMLALGDKVFFKSF